MFLFLVYNLIFFLDVLIRLVVLEQISGLFFSTKKKIGLALILTIVINILFESFYHILEPMTLLIVIPFLKTKWSILQKIFYGLLPMVIGDMFQRIIGLYLRFILDVSITEFNSSLIFNILITILLIPFYFYFFKGLRIESEYLRVDTEDKELPSIFVGLNTLFITYFILIRGNTILENTSDAGMITLSWNTYFIRTNILLIYFILFTISLLHLNYREKEKEEKAVQFLKDQQLIELSKYSNHVEALYREIRKFRHDYTNVLVSLSEAIQDEDISLIRSIYTSVIADSDKKFYKGKYNIARLSNIQNPAMKSLLSAKFLEAQNRKINISVEIENLIDIPNIELIDFIRILSILMDNAIEAAEKCDKGQIIFAYFQESTSKILLIENTTLEEKIDIGYIYKYGYSSKGNNRGIGLSNVRDILSKYPKVNIETVSYQNRFSQKLTFIDVVKRG
ncbi:sensor histidine kinase [Streptococcus phocae subsp. salmonis]